LGRDSGNTPLQRSRVALAIRAAKAACTDVLRIIASIGGAVNGLTVEAIKNQIPCYVSAPSLRTKKRAGAADDLIEVVRPYQNEQSRQSEQRVPFQ
jgi:DNA-binding FrmR family transcriptional regulator